MIEERPRQAFKQPGASLCRSAGGTRQAEPEIAVFLLRDALKRLDILRAGFEEYFRKEDYRFAHEPKGAEQETWLKAVERFVGRSRVPYWLSGTPQSSRNTKEPS